MNLLRLAVWTSLGLSTAGWSQSQPSTQAENGPFRAFQFAVTDLDQLTREWSVPGEGVKLSTSSETQRNKPIFITFVFSGCAPKADGACDVSADLRILAPDGKVYGEQNAEPIWPRAPLAENILMLSDAKLGLRIEDGEALGDYTVRILLRDNVAKRDITTEDVIHVSEAR